VRGWHERTRSVPDLDRRWAVQALSRPCWLSACVCSLGVVRAKTPEERGSVAMRERPLSQARSLRRQAMNFRVTLGHSWVVSTYAISRPRMCDIVRLSQQEVGLQFPRGRCSVLATGTHERLF
jgi:hypothetical protein